MEPTQRNVITHTHSHAPGESCGDDHDGHHHHGEPARHGHGGGAHAHVHGASCSHGGHHRHEPHALPTAAAGATVTWKVGGMDCGSCATTISTALERLPGVSAIRVSITSETLALVLDEKLTRPSEIETQIIKLGYKAHLLQAGPRPVEGETHWWSTHKGRVAIVAGALVAAAYAAGFLWPEASYAFFVIATTIAALPIARRAVMAASAGAPFTIQMLMTIAVIGALAIGAVEESAIVVFLFSIGEILEGVAANRARSGIKALAALVPETAQVEIAGRLTEVAAAALTPGQIVLVRPGDRVPADGKVVDGNSSVDESPITGESIPRSKGPGADVFAGSINQDAAIRVRVERTATENMIARIGALVEEAQDAKAPTERYIDRFSRVYMPAIVGLSLLVGIVPPLLLDGEWVTWSYRALTLLLIGCPCALVISVPAAIAASLSAGACHGLLMKGGAVVETLATIDTVAFDKTGTLTQGRPVVTDVQAFGRAESDLIALAAAVERHSSHPLAGAIVGHAEHQASTLPAVTDARAIAGKGVEASLGSSRIFVGSPRFATGQATFTDAARQHIERLENDGKTVVAVVVDGEPAGLIALRDEPRRDAAAAIAELKGMGIGTVMLTGDNGRTAAAIARVLGIEARAEMLPQDKTEAVRTMAASQRVAMVGDGINDAPALASAHVGVAMGAGTDVALEAADAALLRNRMADVPALLRLSRATMSNIRQNITIALALKAIFLVTTIVGTTGLWMAVIADTGGTVLVTLNALRLLGFFRSEPREAISTAAALTPEPQHGD